jgi:phytoene dehydrogenase-like protein
MTQGARKIVIIGAGIAGLCAAVYARRSGYQVEVLESHDYCGRVGDQLAEGRLHV